MRTYEVTAKAGVRIEAGQLVGWAGELDEERAALLVPVEGQEGVYQAKAPVQFQKGERLALPGKVKAALLKPAEKGAVGAKKPAAKAAGGAAAALLLFLGALFAHPQDLAAADNPSRVTADLTAQSSFTDWLTHEHPGAWDAYCHVEGTYSATVTIQMKLASGDDADAWDVPDGAFTAGVDGAYIALEPVGAVWVRAGIKTGDFTSGTASVTCGVE